MQSVDYSVTDELCKTMKHLEFPEPHYQAIVNSVMFTQASEMDSVQMQRVILTGFFTQVLLSGNPVPPVEIRLHLNAANDTLSWLDDIRLVILPFIKENLDKFLCFSQIGIQSDIQQQPVQ